MIDHLKNVSWMGQLTSSEVWDALAEMDVLVVPSRWPENSPNIILEAQAMGVPVIGTNYGGIPELVQHEHNGLLFKLDNVEDLARQLQRLLDEPDLLPRLKAKQIPFQTVDEEICRIDSLYKEITLSERLGSSDQEKTSLVTQVPPL